MSVIDKQLIAHSFGLAASTYDSAAHFQRWTGECLLKKIPERTTERILDLGCGTGFFSHHLHACAPEASYFGMDLAENMTKYAREHHSENTAWLVGDAEYLPLRDNSFDLVFSSLAIQWCSSLSRLMSDVNRVLKPGGLFVFSTLLDGSLKELKNAWSAIDNKQHVNDFFSKADYERAIQESGLSVELLSEENKVLEYQKLSELMRELKKLGAHNLNSGRSTGLMGKEKLHVLVSEYEKFREPEGHLPASYQLLWGVLVKER